MTDDKDKEQVKALAEYLFYADPDLHEYEEKLSAFAAEVVGSREERNAGKLRERAIAVLSAYTFASEAYLAEHYKSTIDAMLAFAEIASSGEPVAVFGGRRLTPAGTLEFYGYINSENGANLKNGDRLYTHPQSEIAEKDRQNAALTEIAGCFEAAYAEGLTDRLAEQSAEQGTLRDLVERRLLPAYDTAIATMKKEQK